MTLLYPALGGKPVIVSAQLLKDKDWAEITRLATAMVKAAREARQK